MSNVEYNYGTQFDNGGNRAHLVLADLGPSIGLTFVPVLSEVFVTTPGAITIGPYCSVVLLKVSGITSIQLPSVARWVNAVIPGGMPLNSAPFGRMIAIKDMTGAISVGSPVTILPSGTDTIDGLANYSLVTPMGIIWLWPMTDLSGYFVG
jgi:hypothetical protein